MKHALKIFSLLLVSTACADNVLDSPVKFLEPYEELRSPYQLDRTNSAIVFDTPIASTTLGATVNSVHFHPNGKWLAVGGATPGTNSAQVQIFALSATGSALYTRKLANIIHGAAVNEVRWSPDGNYLAICGTAVSSVTTRVFKFDATLGTTVKLTGCDINQGATPQALDWSPDGKYLVVAGAGISNADHVKTYSFDGRALYALPDAKATYINTTGTVNSVRWRSDGTYIAIGGTLSGSIPTTQIFAFDPTYLRRLPGCDVSHGASVYRVTWWGDELATGGNAAAGLVVWRGYTFDGKRLVNTLSVPASPTVIRGMDANETDRYIAIGRTTGGADDTQINALDYYTHGNTVNSVSLSKDRAFFALGGISSGGITVRVLPMTESRDFALKKQKTEVIYLNKLLASTSASLPGVDDLAFSTSTAIDQVISFSLTSLTTVTSLKVAVAFNTSLINMQAPGRFVAWHPSGRYIAVQSVLGGFDVIDVYQYDSALGYLSKISSASVTRAEAVVGAISWSSDGRFLARGAGNDTSPIEVFEFDTVTLRLISSIASQGKTWDVRFVPSNGYLIHTDIQGSDDDLALKSFNGLSLTTITATGNNPPFGQGMSICSDSIGRYFGLADIRVPVNTGAFSIFRFDPLAATLSLLSGTRFNWGGVVQGSDFHPTDNWVTICGYPGTSSVTLRNYLFNGTTLTELPACQVKHGAALAEVKWDPTGQYVAVGGVANASGTTLRIFGFDGNGFSQMVTANTPGSVFGLSWAPDGKSLVMGDTLGNVQVYNLGFSRVDQLEPTLLVDTSNAAAGLLQATANAVLNQILDVANSSALVVLNTLVRTTSNAELTQRALIINTSNALSGLLVRTSQAANALLIPDSQAIVTINNLAVANSTAANNMYPITIGTSNAMANYAPLIISTSNALNGLLRATSNAAAGLLVATSNAAAGLLKVTSNAVATLVIYNSNAVVNLARIGTIDHGPANVHMNSSTMTLSYDLRIGQNSHSLNIHTSGVLDGNGHMIDLARGVASINVDASVTVTFQNVVLKDYSDFTVSLGSGAAIVFGQGCAVELPPFVVLTRTWTFAGSARLKGSGAGSQVDMNSNYMYVAPQSTLKIENAELYNIAQSNVRWIDNTSNIQFENAVLHMTADFSCTLGSFRITKDCAVRGFGAFAYQSNMGSTIESASKLTIDQGISFFYGPTTDFRNLLRMTDSSSVLAFNNSTLVATATGPQLTKGTLLVDGVMTVQSAAASSAEAVIFGDGNPANDLLVDLLPGANIQVTSGYLSYQNAN